MGCVIIGVLAHSLRAVGGTGVIYVVIVGMWALILVPMWLRRHDQTQETKSADRFARAMGSLRRTEAGLAGSVRHVVMPGRDAADHDSRVMVSGHDESPRSDIAVRRQRALIGLGAFFGFVALLTALHVLPTGLLVLPVLLLAGFVVLVRRQVTMAADLRRRREQREILADAARAADARYGADAGRARRGGRVVDPAAALNELDLTLSLERAARAGVSVGATANAMAESGAESWNAVATTLPTYVTAPRATRVPRVIDLTTPGSWSGAAMVEQARESLLSEASAEGEMRVETFQIAVQREVPVRVTAATKPASYSDRYVEDEDGFDGLDDNAALEALLTDPRTGVELPSWRRAANG